MAAGWPCSGSGGPTASSSSSGTAAISATTETEVGSLTLGVTGDGIDCKLTEKGGSAAFSYLLDADDARIVSRNTLEMTVQHVN